MSGVTKTRATHIQLMRDGFLHVVHLVRLALQVSHTGCLVGVALSAARTKRGKDLLDLRHNVGGERPQVAQNGGVAVFASLWQRKARRVFRREHAGVVVEQRSVVQQASERAFRRNQQQFERRNSRQRRDATRENLERRVSAPRTTQQTAHFDQMLRHNGVQRRAQFVAWHVAKVKRFWRNGIARPARRSVRGPFGAARGLSPLQHGHARDALQQQVQRRRVRAQKERQHARVVDARSALSGRRRRGGSTGRNAKVARVTMQIGHRPSDAG